MNGMDLRDVDLNLLVALDALLRHENVTSAAGELGITQPAMSRVLARLRTALGDPVLLRVGRGSVPTERARALAGPVSELLRAAERVFSPPEFDPATASGEVAVALGDEAQAAFADTIFDALWAEAPGIDIRLHNLRATSVDEGRRGVFDVAVAPDLGGLPPIAGAPDLSEFVVKRVYTRRFVVCRAPGTPAPTTLEAYARARHVIVSFDGGRRGFVDDLLAARGLSRRVAATVTSFGSAASIVARTDLVATLPEEVVRTARADLRVTAPPLDIPDVPMLAVWHPRRNADPRHRWLRERVMAAVRRRAETWG